jgi:dipeptidyl aminopeptidase/acylaminoacyl peptidase
MAAPRIADYGTWASPISATELATAAIGVDHVNGDHDRLTWVESRPAEGGRLVVVELDPASAAPDEAEPRWHECTPTGFNVRTRVHEYGGLAYARLADGTLLFSHFDDQRVHLQRGGAAPVPITPSGCRYADFAAAPNGTVLACVREDHRTAGEVENAVVLLKVDPITEAAGDVLWSDSDFVAYPRFSADGRLLAFIAWNHPSMPWDATTLRVGALVDGRLRDIVTIAGGEGESVLEPRWDRDGTLYFLSDRRDFWELYRWRGGRVEAVATAGAALGGDGGGPLWTLGNATYALAGDGRAVMRISGDGDDRLCVVDLERGTTTALALPYAQFHSLVAIGAGRAAVVATSTDQPSALITFDLAGSDVGVVRRPGTVDLPNGLISRGEPIEFATAPGADGAARTAHAFFYPPSNPGFVAPEGARPPLLVQLHGGPTSQSRRGFSVARQFWTSRGFAVVDVNYGGSTGFGRRYRERLNGEWGVVDVADAVAAVDYLVSTGQADPDTVAIRGASAGGFTTLAALAFTDRFRAGANYFGVADIEALARDTHKFESRYLDRLIAPLPEGRDIYRARSPLFHLERFSRPLITLQGAEDRIVPPAQSRAIVDALRERGVPVAYLEFPGEQHGFRRAPTIIRAHEAELYFYGRVFGFTPADPIEPVPIEHLDPPAS